MKLTIVTKSGTTTVYPIDEIESLSFTEICGDDVQDSPIIEGLANAVPSEPPMREAPPMTLREEPPMRGFHSIPKAETIEVVENTTPTISADATKIEGTEDVPAEAVAEVQGDVQSPIADVPVDKVGKIEHKDVIGDMFDAPATKPETKVTFDETSVTVKQE